jgi:hypothetical protein
MSPILKKVFVVSVPFNRHDLLGKQFQNFIAEIGFS